MATSKSSISQKKRDQIIDGRLFSRSSVLDRLRSEIEDTESMETIISKILNQGIHRIGSSRTGFYDEEIVEEFYHDASVKLYSHKQGGGVRDIRATVQGIPILINSSLLESIYALPTEGMTIEELETFGTEKLLTTYWGLFTGDKSRKDIYMSCPKKNFCLPFVYLHDFCCRIIENRTGAFDSCTNLRYRMMVAILYGEKVDWCQFVLNRLGEEVLKPHSQKKSFGLFLNNLLYRCGVNLSPDAKKIGPGKYLGGSNPIAYNHAGPIANRPFIETMPNIQHPKRSLEKPSTAVKDVSKKRKRSVSDSMSPLTERKKLKKDSRSKSAWTVTHPVTIDDHPSAKTANLSSQEALQASSPVPTASLSDQQIFANLENLDSSVQIDSMINSPVRVPIPDQDPTHYRAPSPVCDLTHSRTPSPVSNPNLNRPPSPVRDPSPNRTPTPVRDPSPIQAPIPVEDPKPTVEPIPVRSPSQENFFNPLVEQAFQRFKQWKSYRLGSCDILLNWKEWKQEEEFILSITDVKEAQPLIQWDDEHCHMLIMSHFMFQDETRQQAKGKSAIPDLTSYVEIEEQHSTKVDTGLPGASTSQATPRVIRPEPQANARTEQQEDLSRQTVFLTEAVDALYNVGKEMDWLKLSAIEETASVQDEISKLKIIFDKLPEEMKSIVAELQKQQEKILLDEQSKLRICESKSVAALDYSNSIIADHDKKIEEMTLFINSLAERIAKLETQQENVVKTLQNIDLLVSEINVKKGEEAQEESIESASRRPSERDSNRSQSSRHEQHFRRH
ncbi:hypothetical protein OROMI_011437 [Orobanche minor]